MTDKSSLAAGSLAGALARPQSSTTRGLVLALGVLPRRPPAGRWAWAISGNSLHHRRERRRRLRADLLACILTIGIPLLMAEVMIGRAGRQNPAGSVARLAALAGASAHWRKVGWLGAFTGFLILSFYVVIAGWALAYVPATLGGAFSGADAASTAQFDALLADPLRLVLYGSAVWR
ncbi:Transporter OS=Stutzerimonas stutzeri OX=316 GN=CXK95_03480 PE=3 SV=1 [Stutzerimonas stutzeri]